MMGLGSLTFPPPTCFLYRYDKIMVFDVIIGLVGVECEQENENLSLERGGSFEVGVLPSYCGGCPSPKCIFLVPNDLIHTPHS